MPPTPSASGVCMGAGCKAAGCCKAAGLQAAGLRAAGVKAGQFAQRGGNVVLLHLEVQNSSHLSRASRSKEQNLDTLAKRTPKSGPSVVNSTRIACFGGGGGGSPPGGGGGGGGGVPPRPPQPQPKGSRLKATPTRRGSADLLRYLRSGVSPVVIAKDPVLQLCAMGLTR